MKRISYISFGLLIGASSAWADILSDADVKLWRANNASSISSRKTQLNTSWDAVAILDICREQMSTNKSFLDLWQSVMVGRGFANGVVQAPVLRTDERNFMINACKKAGSLVGAEVTFAANAGKFTASNPSMFSAHLQAIDQFLAQGEENTKPTHVLNFNDFVAPSAEAFANSLTEGMNTRDKSNVFYALKAVPAERLTAEFVDAVNMLTQEMDLWNKINVIFALKEVPAERITPEFVDAVNMLTQGMNADGKHEVIVALLGNLSGRLTREYVDAVNMLTQEMDPYNKIEVIFALKEVPAERITPEFVDAVNCLSPETNASVDKSNVFYALAGLPAECLTREFVDAVNRLSQGMNANEKRWMIDALARLPAERLTAEFVDAVNMLTQGMNAGGKNEVIDALAGLPAERLTAEFVDAVKRMR